MTMTCVIGVLSRNAKGPESDRTGAEYEETELVRTGLVPEEQPASSSAINASLMLTSHRFMMTSPVNAAAAAGKSAECDRCS
jgi:hypothetical protein